MRLGVMVNLHPDVEKSFKQLREINLFGCQLCCWDTALFTEEIAVKVREETDKYGINISTLWCGWPGPKVWNFYDGHLTLGLIPAEYRNIRIEALKQGSDFAKLLGVCQIATHAGFIPENPLDPVYTAVLAALKEIVNYCERNNQRFLFETGQETPVTLLRVIEDIGKKNVGVNLDPANLLLYGKANPADALDILGPYIFDIHAKDGEYPVNGRVLGEEKPLGRGKVNFPLFIEKLKKLGYDGPVTIEREISGEQQKKDILEAINLLEPLISVPI
jgi:sugar phosphate isomerase/epimerase